MDQQNISLLHLPTNKKAKITSIDGGHEGQEIKVVSKQPFRGPITIKVCGSQMTLGRGMARRILVEEMQ